MPPDQDTQPVQEFGGGTAGLAQMHTYGLLRDTFQLAENREGVRTIWREDILFELQQAVDNYPFAHRLMRECGRKLESYLANLPARLLDRPSPAVGPQAPAPQKAQKAKKPQGNAPALDLQAELERICEWI